jgi:hypothetical protein
MTRRSRLLGTRLRGNASGRRRAFWELDWTCAGCHRVKRYTADRTRTLAGLDLCSTCYGKHINERAS